jgi:hypothetical protein
MHGTDHFLNGTHMRIAARGWGIMGGGGRGGGGGGGAQIVPGRAV